MKVLLLGYMGSGKSTIGRILAQKLNQSFLDLDNIIEKNEGKSVAEIIRNKGEIHFRKIEQQYFNQLLDQSESFILALGGGTPVYAGNHHRLKENGITSIYLRANIPTLVNRLQDELAQRPLLDNKDDLSEFIAKHLFERSPFYNEATYTIAVDGKSIDDIVQEIEQKLA